jgi:NAD(P)H-flavin reductase
MAPYRAMLPELERRARQRPVRVTLLMGVRTRGERIYYEEFAEFAGRSSLRTFIVCYSQGQPASGGAPEYRGYVQDTLRRLPLTPGQEHVYLCGSPQMIDECSRVLSERGFEKHYLMRDETPDGGTAWF